MVPVVNRWYQLAGSGWYWLGPGIGELRPTRRAPPPSRRVHDEAGERRPCASYALDLREISPPARYRQELQRAPPCHRNPDPPPCSCSRSSTRPDVDRLEGACSHVPRSMASASRYCKGLRPAHGRCESGDPSPQVMKSAVWVSKPWAVFSRLPLHAHCVRVC